MRRTAAPFPGGSIPSLGSSRDRVAGPHAGEPRGSRTRRRRAHPLPSPFRRGGDSVEPRRSVSVYEVRAAFSAPLDFVFRWCTDYRSNDAQYEGADYERRILQRSRHRVVFENLEDSNGGWVWSRYDVRLSPPDRWHAESIGNQRRLSLDYRLSRLSDTRTALVLHGRRVPYGVGERNPPKREWEGAVGGLWRNLARALERDYRRARLRRTRR